MVSGYGHMQKLNQMLVWKYHQPEIVTARQENGNMAVCFLTVQYCGVFCEFLVV